MALYKAYPAMDPKEVLPIIARAKNREQAAFGELYDIYASPIFRFISLKTATREQAEDILQETFFKAWQALPKLSLENLNFRAWLYKIARNLVNDHYRTLQRRPTPDTIENYYNLSSSDDTHETTAKAFDIERLRSIMNQLAPTYRQVLELRFIQEFSVEETAKIMGKTALAVRVAQHRALKKLNLLVIQTDEPYEI